jgi:hypothetical protein
MKIATLEVIGAEKYPLVLTECGATKFKKGDKIKVAEEMLAPMKILYHGDLRQVGLVEETAKLDNGHWELVKPVESKPDPVPASETATQEKPLNKSMAGKAKARTKAVEYGAGNAQ